MWVVRMGNSCYCCGGYWVSHFQDVFTLAPMQRMGFYPYGRLVVNTQYWKCLVGLSSAGIPSEVCYGAKGAV